ncbi:MAG: hypothetical protein WC867_00975 [Candidatus Pacearchaeota archaeon]|jgi:hypothetical protein
MKKESYSKIILFTILTIFITIIITESILAQTTSNPQSDPIAQAAARGIQGTFQGFFEIFFGTQHYATRTLFGLLLFFVLMTIIPSIFGEENKAINMIICVIVTILSMLAIPPQLYEVMITQYGAMGATIITIIPFMVILTLTVMAHNALFARVLWIFYAMYYFGLYLYKLSININNSINSGLSWYQIWITGEYIPYILAIIAGCCMFLFIGPIRKLIFYGEYSAMEESGKRIVEKGQLLHKLQSDELRKSYGVNSGR